MTFGSRALSATAILLGISGCDGDPARLSEGPRYVWVDSGVSVVTPAGEAAEVRAAGYAFASGPPERASMRESAVIFRDSTALDTLGFVGSAWLEPVGPDGAEFSAGDPSAARARVVVLREPAADSGAVAATAESAGDPETREGYPACLTEELLDQMLTAVAQKDRRGGAYLLENGCVALRGGLPVSVLETRWGGTLQMRVYVDDEALVLWAPHQAVANYP